MSRLHPRLLPLLALGVAASVALAACGSSDDSSDSTASASADATTAASSSSGSSGSGSGTVDLADNSTLGTQILVDDQGRTLYLFEKDTASDKSTCSGTCAGFWPPLTTKGDATAGSGLDSSQLSTFKREDGTTQVSYAGHPLYYYSGDQAPGDATGNGIDKFGAEWYAMDSSGETVEDEGSAEEDSSGDDSTSDDSTSEDSTSEDSTSEDSGGGYSPY